MNEKFSVTDPSSNLISPFDSEFDPVFYSKGKSHFQLAFRFVSSPRRKEALERFYAFCRLVDDIVDEGEETAEPRRARLDQIRKWLTKEKDTTHLFWSKLSQDIEELELPRECFLGIVKGVSKDLEEKRMESWDELNEYVQGVACDVGEVVLHIIGAGSPKARHFAQHYGRCVQYLNIMRDLEKDLKENRYYVPQEFLNRKGVSSVKKMALPEVREELFARAVHFYEQGKPYSNKCLPAEIMCRIYLEAAQKYWRWGNPKRLSKMEMAWIAFRTSALFMLGIRKSRLTSS